MRIRPPFFALMLLAFSCLPFVSSCNAAPKAPSVVSVDMQRLMTESEPAKQASEHLKQVRAVLQKGFEELRETYEGTPKDERETILANGLAALNRQMELETRAASQVVNRIVVEEISKWRKTSGVSLVIARSIVIDGDMANADYTKTRLAAVNERKATFAVLPSVNIEKQEGKAAEKKLPEKSQGN